MIEHSLAARAAPSIVLQQSRGSDDRITALGTDVVALADRYGGLRQLLIGIAEHSPFLWSLCERDPERLAAILASDPDVDLARIFAETEAACAAPDTDVRKRLRGSRAHVALLVALADLGGLWPLERVTEALTAAADTFVRCATIHALRATARRNANLKDIDPETGCGLFVLALGKHGAGELNYSSDIDLVVFYDPAVGPIEDTSETGPFFVRVTQLVARTLSDRTEDGYVARVDLRLRPDPGATPVAISVDAALSYYETLGQNWERAAFIKARPIAGALDSGTRFLRELEPFIWRRYLDYAAIADIHAMKRQIHAVRGFDEITVAGHDVKLGRGGIREIEFFVQTQQLVFGGRWRDMRGRRTLDMLARLAAEGWVTDEARRDLTDAYVALRTVEHRLQMIADEQTQRLPTEEATLERFARFCGFASISAFETWITDHFRAVEKHYARLFEHAPGLDASAGALVFTGAADDPATIETLRAMGYRQPATITETIRGWHFGHRPAVRSARAREVLTDLIPALLQSFAKCGDPDAAIAAFDEALARMPAATELFAILRASAALRVLFGDILGAAPRLTSIVTATPHVLDTIIDPRSFRLRYDEATFADDVTALSAIGNTEEFLDRCRLVARENQFAIGVRVLSRTIEPYAAGPAYSELAATLVRAAFEHVQQQFRRDHGAIDGLELAVIALGKLGSHEMTASSDLDLMIVYDASDRTAGSDGPRSLSPPQYATRLTQRLVAALTAPTREGRLYDIDLRLRPWGTQGPLAVTFDAFADYHADEAETWERMALCRARPIAGTDAFRTRVSSQIASILRRAPRSSLAADVAAMRGTIEREKGRGDADDLKLLPGGLLDIEFIAQYLILRYGADHPHIVGPETRAVIAAADLVDLLPPDIGDALRAAHRLYSDVMQVQRLALPADAKPARWPANARRLIATSAGYPDAAALGDAIAEAASAVRKAFQAILHAPSH